MEDVLFNVYGFNQVLFDVEHFYGTSEFFAVFVVEVVFCSVEVGW